LLNGMLDTSDMARWHTKLSTAEGLPSSNPRGTHAIKCGTTLDTIQPAIPASPPASTLLSRAPEPPELAFFPRRTLHVSGTVGRRLTRPTLPLNLKV